MNTSKKKSDGVHIINMKTLSLEEVMKTGLGPDPMIMWFPPSDYIIQQKLR